MREGCPPPCILAPLGSSTACATNINPPPHRLCPPFAAHQPALRDRPGGPRDRRPRGHGEGREREGGRRGGRGGPIRWSERQAALWTR